MLVLVAQFLFVILLSPSSPMAQTSITVGGVVEDRSAALLLGATVRLLSAGAPRTTSTDQQGRFVFQGVSPGNYKLEAVAAGFKTKELEITVGTESPTRFSLKLEINPQATEVTVSADPPDDSTEPEDNADALKLDDDLLENVPIAGDDVLSAIANFGSIAAQGSEGLSVVVDGMQGGGLDVPASAISSLKINKNPYGAEFRRPGKGTVQLKTEKGSKKSYHGSFALIGRNSFFDARNAFAASKPDLDRRLMSASFGGPLGGRSRRLFVSGERLRNNETAIVNAITAAGPFRANVPTPQVRGKFLTKFDLRPSEAHAVSFNYGLTDDSQKNQGVKGFQLPEQAVSEQQRKHRFQVSYGAIVSANLINDLRVVFEREKEREGSDQTAVAPTVVVEGAFTGGPSPYLRKEENKQIDVQDAFTSARGIQTFRFGVQYQTRIGHVSDASNFNGTFQFGSLDDFVAGRPFVFRVNQGRPFVNFTVSELSGFFQDEIRLSPQLSLVLGLRHDWQSSVNDRNNFAPRLGLAYAPVNQKTVLRGGAGFFYEHLSDSVTERALLFDGSRLQQVVIPEPRYPEPFSGAPGIIPPPSVTRVAPEIRSPYLFQTSISVERELWAWTKLSLDYSHLRGVHLFRSRDINATLPAVGVRPDSSFSNINQVESSASLKSDAFSIVFRGKVKNVFKATAQYTLSHSTNDTAGTFSLPADNFDLRPEWGPADYDQKHRFNLAGFQEFPGEVRLGSIFSTASGAPFDITTGFDDNGDTVGNDRPFGMTRNRGRGPSTVRLDLRLTKRFEVARLVHWGDRQNKGDLQFSIDAFNVINRANFEHIVGAQSSPFFGRANSASPARTIQLSMNYKF